MVKLNKTLLWVATILVVTVAWWYFSLPPFNKQASTTGPGQISGTTIEIKNSSFSPNPLNVKPGEKITVVSRDLMGHSVTADDGSFDSGVLSLDKSALIIAPLNPGTYKFHCLVHPTTMMGTLIVK